MTFNMPHYSRRRVLICGVALLVPVFMYLGWVLRTHYGTGTFAQVSRRDTRTLVDRKGNDTPTRPETPQPQSVIEQSATAAQNLRSQTSVIEDSESLVEGRVVDAAGRGLDCVRVLVGGAEAESGLLPVIVNTKADGVFLCTLRRSSTAARSLSRPLRVLARAELQGYLPVEREALLSQETPPRATMELLLVRGPTIVGRVLHFTGQPIRLARVCTVQLDSLETDKAVTQTITDKDGTYSLTMGRPGTYDVWAVADGCLPKGQRAVLRSLGDVSKTDIVLEEGYFLAGLILGGDGQPIARARVAALLLYRKHGDNSCPPVTVEGASVGRTVTDEYGRFRIASLIPGQYEVQVIPRPLPAGLTLGDCSRKGITATVPGPEVVVQLQVGTLEMTTDVGQTAEFKYRVGSQDGSLKGKSFTLHLPAASAYDVKIEVDGYESFVEAGASWPSGVRTMTLRRRR